MSEQSKILEQLINEQLNKSDESIKRKRDFEISPEAKEERRLLTAFLFDKKEELIKQKNERKQKVEAELIELRNGKFISRLEIRQFVTSLIQNYPSIFPNDNPFFKNMFRLHPKLMGLDYNNYEKPRLAGKLLKHLTYDRFEIEVLPVLIVFAMPDGVRLTKCYKYLTQYGIEQLIKFRNDANDMMKDFKDGEWYEFNAKFCSKYKKQPRLF